MAGGGYPVSLDLDAPLEIARWRPFVQWFLAIPQWFVLYVLNAVLEVLWFIALITILFTKRIPPAVYDFMSMILRYNWRVQSYAVFLREEYPPFDFTATARDPGGDPAVLSTVQAAEFRRLMPLIKWLLIIPQLFVLFFVWIAAYVLVIVAAFAILFTGRWPEGLRRFTIGTARWTTRVNAYIYLMVDPYPPFALD